MDHGGKKKKNFPFTVKHFLPLKLFSSLILILLLVPEELNVPDLLLGRTDMWR